MENFTADYIIQTKFNNNNNNNKQIKDNEDDNDSTQTNYRRLLVFTSFGIVICWWCAICHFQSYVATIFTWFIRR